MYHFVQVVGKRKILFCSIWWPISLLSNAKKIIEKCMQMQFLIDHDILYQKQCGFQKKSNVQAVINIIEDIEKSTWQ